MRKRKNKQKYQKTVLSLLLGFFGCLLERGLLSPFRRTGFFFAEYLAGEFTRTDTGTGIGARVRLKLITLGAGGGICSSRSRWYVCAYTKLKLVYKIFLFCHYVLVIRTFD